MSPHIESSDIKHSYRASDEDNSESYEDSEEESNKIWTPSCDYAYKPRINITFGIALIFTVGSNLINFVPICVVLC